MPFSARSVAEPTEDTPLWRMLTPADWVSSGNALLGVLAVFLISLDHIEWAVLAIFAAVIGDGVDGALARRGLGGGPFGGKLDSFADFSAFGIAPATLIFHTYYQWEIVTQVRGPDFLTALAVGAAGAAFVLAGIMRLIRFEVLQGGERRDVFLGLAIPAAALLVTTATYLQWPSHQVLALTVICAVLMVSRIRFPKIRGILAPPALLAILGTIAFRQSFHGAAPKLLLSLMVTYVVLGPLFARWRAARVDHVAAWNA